MRDAASRALVGARAWRRGSRSCRRVFSRPCVALGGASAKGWAPATGAREFRAAAREIFDRLEGRPTQAIELGRRPGEDSVAIEQLRKMPPAVAVRQLDAAIRKLSELRAEFLSTGKTVDVEAKALTEACQTEAGGPESGIIETGWPEGAEIVDVGIGGSGETEGRRAD